MIDLPEYLTWVWIVGGSLEIGMRLISRNRFRPSVLLGHFVYGGLLVVWRLARWLIKKSTRLKQERRVQKPARPKEAHSATECLTVHRLKPMEVILGRGRSGAIKINLDRSHTLIAGVTRSGKTNIINAILVQLFGKNSRFSAVAEVVLLDLKGDEDDSLAYWKPMCRQFFSITEPGRDIEQAILLLDQIATSIHVGSKKKHLIVIIDEVAALTVMASDTALRRAGNAVLSNLAMKLGSRGTLILATQHPRYDVISRSITTNLDRKIGLAVDGDDHFELIFRHRPRKDTRRPSEPGEFLLRDPDRRGRLVFGRSFEVKQSEIDAIVFKYIEALGHEDDRLKLLSLCTANLDVGASLPGVRIMAGTLKENGQMNLKQDQVSAWYRNYALAGAFTPPQRKGQSYKLKVPQVEAMALVRQYLLQGQWKQDPESFIAG